MLSVYQQSFVKARPKGARSGRLVVMCSLIAVSAWKGMLLSFSEVMCAVLGTEMRLLPGIGWGWKLVYLFEISVRKGGLSGKCFHLLRMAVTDLNRSMLIAREVVDVLPLMRAPADHRAVLRCVLVPEILTIFGDLDGRNRAGRRLQ